MTKIECNCLPVLRGAAKEFPRSILLLMSNDPSFHLSL